MKEAPLGGFLRAELLRLSEQNLLRSPRELDAAGRTEGTLLLCSNDYLGYAREPWPLHAAADIPTETTPSGAGASRLVSGDHRAHRMAEQRIADWLGAESALLFSSGYAANIGVISALARPGDCILSDALNHASIIDGCRLSGAHTEIIPHLDVEALQRVLAASTKFRRRWVITESYFSMDGDIPDLSRLRSLCNEHGAILYVDEAHALGVFGPNGAGLCAEAGIHPDIQIGTLGKALGLQGAFMAGSALLRTYLWNRARSFVFSTGISPLLAQAIIHRVDRVSADHAGRAKLHSLSQLLRTHLLHIGADRCLASRRGPILPWIVGDARRAIELSNYLADRGVFVQAIRPPTVPSHTSRLRFCVSSALSEQELMAACEHITACLKEEIVSRETDTEGTLTG